MIYAESKTKSKNRQKIVDAAFRIAFEKGVSYTTVMDIVAEANIERKTFYNYFSGREELLDYIYYQCLYKFYEVGFTDENYLMFNNGFEKTKYYFETIVSHFKDYHTEMVFAIQYDHYTNKKNHHDLVEDIYKAHGIIHPYKLFLEGVRDNTINIGEKPPYDVYMLLNQAVGAFSSRIISRTKDETKENIKKAFTQVYDLLEMLLNSIKKDI